MKAVEVQFSLEALRQFLHLPETVKFTKVSQTYGELYGGKFSLVVEGEELPETLEGNHVPWGRIVIHTAWCNSEERTHIVRGEVVAA